MRIMIRSWSEKCQVHDAEFAAEPTAEEGYLYLIFHTVLPQVLQHLDQDDWLDVIDTCLDANDH